MAVSHDDVKHVAELARLTIPAERLDALVNELNGILGHMEALSKVSTAEIEQRLTAPSESTPLRSDSGEPMKLQLPIGEIAPATRDGFFVVPRLATHSDGETPA